MKKPAEMKMPALPAPAQLTLVESEPTHAKPLFCRFGFHKWLSLRPTDAQFKAFSEMVGGDQFYAFDLLSGRSRDLWNRICVDCGCSSARLSDVIEAGKEVLK